jgi:outer membrane receptor protein involved in Fe transport
MVTAIDCCVSYPIWNAATGQLDGSIRYNATDNIEISFQASNILSEETVLEQQVENTEDGGLRLPNAWFQNDRRYTLGVRFKY